MGRAAEGLSPRATNITGVLITGEVGVSFVEIELDGKPRVFANGIDRPRRLADKLSRHRRGCAVVGLRLISLASDPTNVSIRPGNGGPPVSEDANQPSEADAGEDVRNP